MDDATRSLLIRGIPLIIALVMVVRARRLSRRRPEHERKLVDAMLTNEKLRKKDPSAAERELSRLVAQHAQEEKQYRAELQARAPLDPKAARELRSRLLEELKGIDELRREIENDPTQDSAKGLKELESEEQLLRSELAALEARTKRLP